MKILIWPSDRYIWKYCFVDHFWSKKRVKMKQLFRIAVFPISVRITLKSYFTANIRYFQCEQTFLPSYSFSRCWRIICNFCKMLNYSVTQAKFYCIPWAWLICQELYWVINCKLNRGVTTGSNNEWKSVLELKILTRLIQLVCWRDVWG